MALIYSTSLKTFSEKILQTHINPEKRPKIHKIRTIDTQMNITGANIYWLRTSILAR